MLKFPTVPKRNKVMSYTNGCISEYLACHIFASLGFKTQETILGTYIDSRGKEKVVVACRDFTESDKRLLEFAHLKNTCIDSEQNGYGKELSSILQAINEQTLLPPDQLRDFFWDMFIADALLGNFDRHNGNEEEGKKISYFEFISSLKNTECTKALERVYTRIDMEKIYKIINGTPTLLPVQKEFYSMIISERKVKIIDYSMERLMKRK